jgi:predicted SprT family Zn-dependent metalloprotease
LKVKEWKIIHQADGIRKQSGVTILIADKEDFKPLLEEIKKVTTSNEGNNLRKRYIEYKYKCTEHCAHNFIK